MMKENSFMSETNEKETFFFKKDDNSYNNNNNDISGNYINFRSFLKKETNENYNYQKYCNCNINYSNGFFNDDELKIEILSQKEIDNLQRVTIKKTSFTNENVILIQI